MYRALIIAMPIVAVLANPGCKSSSDNNEPLIVTQDDKSQPPAAEPASDKKAIGLVIKAFTNPFFVSLERGARKAAEEHGVELILKTGAQETGIEQQNASIRDLIKQKVDAIVFTPVSSTGVIPALLEAQKAGIVLINIDNPVNPEQAEARGLAPIPFISVDNVESAYISAKYLSSKISKPGKVAILEGVRTATNAQERTRGAKRAFAEKPSLELVAVESANWKVDEANQIAGQILEEHPDIRGVFCGNDMMALGAIQLFGQKNKGDVLVVGYDAVPEARAAITEGKMLASVDQQPDQQGYKGVESAVQALGGKTLPAVITIDAALVTAESLDASKP